MVMGGMEVEQQMMGDCEFEDQKLSEKVMTVDCLRGRLLAERNASKAANEEAELIEKRLEELERRVKSEAKFKKKAEKILKLVMSKLEALKLPISPTKTELIRKEHQPNNQIADSKSCSTIEEEDDHSSSLSDQCSMVKQDDFTSNGSGSTSLGGETSESQQQDFEQKEDNSLAIVKVEENEETRKNSKTTNSLHQMEYDFPKDTNVYEVLMALRNAREQLQASITRTTTTIYRSKSMGLCGARDYILKSPII